MRDMELGNKAPNRGQFNGSNVISLRCTVGGGIWHFRLVESTRGRRKGVKSAFTRAWLTRAEIAKEEDNYQVTQMLLSV